MLRFFTGLYLFHTVTSTIVSDSGCHCALQKNTTTTPSAAASATVGCSYKTDWTGQPSKWCLTDQTAAFCGTNQTNFGFVDSCATAGFTSIVVGSSATSALGMQGSAFFTGQNLAINWTTQNILPDETIKITYLRTSFTAPNTGYARSRIADATSSVTTGTNVTLSTVSSPAVATNGTQTFSITLSAVTGITAINNVTLVAQGTQVQILGQNLTVAWTGVGQAGVGTATVTLRSNGGGGGGGTIVGTPVTLAPVQMNNSVPYLIPRSFVPSGFGGTTYSVTVSVLSPGAPAAYTATGSSFSLVAAPSTTATPTPSVSPTQTMTPAASPSGSLSASATLTSSQTPSHTPSPTQPINLAAIAANASQQAASTFTIIIGSIVGGLVFLCMAGLIGYRIYQRKLLHEKRLRTIAVSKRMDDMTRVYGVVVSNPGALNQYSARAVRSPRNRSGS